MKGRRGLLVAHLLEDRVRLLAGTAGLWRSDIFQTTDIPGGVRAMAGDSGWSTGLIREMEQFTLRYGLRNPLAVLAISRGLLFLRTFTVPPVPRANLDGLIAFEVDKHLPSRPEQLLFRCLPLAQTPEGWIILLSGTRRDLLHPVEEGMEMLGMRPAAVLPDLAGLVHLARQQWQAVEGQTSALVRLDDAGVETAVLTDGVPCLYRRISLAPPPGAVQGEETASEQIIRVSADAAEAIERSLQEAASVLPPGRTVTRGFLFAETGSDLVLQRLPASTRVPWQALRPGDIPAAGARGGEGDRPHLMVTVGVALAATEAAASPLNLLAAKVPSAPRRSGRRVAAVMAAVLAALGLFHLGSLEQRRQSRLEELERITSGMKGQVEAVQKLNDEMKREESRLRSLEGVVARRVTTVQILRELTKIIPSGAYLTQLTVKKGAVELNGLADGASGLISQLEASPMFKNVSFDAPITSSGNKERFKIKMNLE